jgi:ribonucleoside-triphosphate reductase
MDKGQRILSEITIYSKYAKYISNQKRRETWEEIVDRYKIMLIKKYPQLETEIESQIHFILSKQVLPSMRALQFAGDAIEVNNARTYNCAYLPIDSIYSFNETMFLLLGGSGVGYSVQKHHVAKLPEIHKPLKTRKFVVQDDIMGWADAVKALFKAYFMGKALPVYDFSQIRKKGVRLVTAGGKAPGPEPLKLCLFHVQAILDRKQDGDKLSPLECHDMLCHIANAVLAGGIRRAAMIALFSIDDDQMLTCKFGSWWELNEQRGRSNNSVIIKRGSITEEEFKYIWKKVELSGSGEPGIYWTNDLESGTNPCCEIALNPFQFCNLCEINVSDIESQGDLNDRVCAAAFFGTLQAGFTDFYYLRQIWKKTTEKEALLGIGMTGIGSGSILKYDLKEAASLAKMINSVFSNRIGINAAARVTCIKPSGTTSCVLGTSSGIHAWHDEYYLRTIRFNKNEDIASYLIVNHSELVEDDKLRPHDTICVRIPIKSPAGSILRTESAFDTLNRVKKFSQDWVLPGHGEGINSHNVSATVSIKPEEWEEVGKWMWDNKLFYNGLSVLPHDGGSYIQAPFESISKEEYERRFEQLSPIDLLSIIELDDNVNFNQEAACSGGKCEI